MDLCAPLAQDRREVLYCIVVGIECIRSFFRECARLTHRGANEAEIADGGWNERRDRVGRRRREQDSESKSCRTRSDRTHYSRGSLPKPEFQRARLIG